MPKKEIKKVKVQGYIHPYLMAHVEHVAKEKAVTISDIVAVALNQYVSTHGDK